MQNEIATKWASLLICWTRLDLARFTSYLARRHTSLQSEKQATRTTRTRSALYYSIRLAIANQSTPELIATAMPGIRKRTAAAEVEDDTLDSLMKPLEQVPQLFSASQHSVASHRKHVNTLHALFLRCAKVTKLSSDGKSIKLSGERKFEQAFRNAVVYPLGVKKGVEQADRVIKFVGGLVAFAVEHGKT